MGLRNMTINLLALPTLVRLIRTYNFPQNRVTDHRIGLTMHQLEQVMDGKLQPLIDALVTHYQGEKLKAEAAGG